VKADGIVRFLFGRARVVFLAACLFAALALVRAVLTYANLRSDLEELLPRSAPSVQALDEARRRLPGLRHLGVVVDTGGPQNADAALRFLSDLEGRVHHYPKGLVAGVRSGIAAERRFLETRALALMEPGDVAKLREAVEARHRWEVAHRTGMSLLDESEDPPPPLPLKELEEKYRAKHGAPPNFPNDRFLSEDRRTAVLVIQAASHTTSLGDDEALLSHVERDIRELGFPNAYAPELRVGFAGDVATHVEESRGIAVDLGVSGAIVFTLVLGAIAWFFRSLLAVPVLVGPVVFGALYTFGLVALPPLSIRHLNSNTAFLSSIIIGNGLNSGIILLARFREERRRGAALEPAMRVALTETSRATFGASAAAAASYATLLFTDFRGFNQFGWIGAIGMLVCWATTYLLVPPFVAIFGKRLFTRVEPAESHESRGLTRLVLGHPRPVLAVTLTLFVLGTLGIFKRNGTWLETNFSRLRRADSFEHGERYWGPRMDATLHTYLTPAVIMTDSPEAAARAATAVRGLVREGRAGGLVATVRTVEDVLPAYRNQSLEEAKKLAHAVTPAMLEALSPEDRSRVERVLSPAALAPLEADEVPATLLSGLRDSAGHVDHNVLVFPKIGACTWDAAKMAEFSADLREAAGSAGDHSIVVGGLLLSSDIISAMRHDGPVATAAAMGAVLVVALLAFRSLGLSLAAVGSLVVGITLMLGFAAWTGQRLNFSNLIALPITFGVAADYSINVLKRYQARGELEQAIGKTGGAVALCSATTVIGFASLIVAQNRALRSFGELAISGELACLGTAVLALPAYLAWRAGGHGTFAKPSVRGRAEPGVHGQQESGA
jgi:predicted RND superfamily exporter protein